MLLLLRLVLPLLLQELQVLLRPLVRLAPLLRLMQDERPLQELSVPQQRLSPQPLPA